MSSNKEKIKRVEITYVVKVSSFKEHKCIYMVLYLKKGICIKTKEQLLNSNKNRFLYEKIFLSSLTQNLFHCHVSRKDSDLSFFVYTLSQIKFDCITSLIREKDKLFHVSQA